MPNMIIPAAESVMIAKCRLCTLRTIRQGADRTCANLAKARNSKTRVPLENPAPNARIMVSGKTAIMAKMGAVSRMSQSVEFIRNDVVFFRLPSVAKAAICGAVAVVADTASRPMKVVTRDAAP